LRVAGGGVFVLPTTMRVRKPAQREYQLCC
jgi:hypothetical protein